MIRWLPEVISGSTFFCWNKNKRKIWLWEYELLNSSYGKYSMIENWESIKSFYNPKKEPKCTAIMPSDNKLSVWKTKNKFPRIVRMKVVWESIWSFHISVMTPQYAAIIMHSSDNKLSTAINMRSDLVIE